MANEENHQRAFAAWKDHTSAGRLETDSHIHKILRHTFPRHHVTRTSPSKCDVLGYAAAGHATAVQRINDEYDATRVYRLPNKLEGKPGRLEDVVNFGRWDYEWRGYEFVVYEASYVNRFSQYIKLLYLLAPATPGQLTEAGYHEKTDDLLLASGQWTTDVHDQIWLYDNAQWVKSKALWKGVQDATWDDVVLDAATKIKLNQDVHGFFDNRAMYQNAKIPWKRGIIFHGVPGNGKTISIKALINSLAARSPPIPSLYVKSLDACSGPKWSIQQIFQKARRAAPCLLILEDLDSLVGDNTRSYFLNEIDGLESNDGILMVGTTNHIDRLDSAITKRPSRFDRKYLFELPAEGQRLAYCRWWRHKLLGADSVDLPDEACSVISKLTDGYSFAYLKELFVTSLLIYTQAKLDQAGTDDDIEGADDGLGSETGEQSDAAAEIPESLRDNKLLRIIRSQAVSLRKEMDHTDNGSVQIVASAAPPIQYRMAAPLDDGDDY